MRRALAAGLVVAALVGATAASAAVDQATVRINKGAGGVTLGATRAQVLARLGAPVSENTNGVLTYATGSRIFDVYLSAANRVRMMILSGRNYCTAGGICARRAGGVGKLLARYGPRLVAHTNGDGLECYFLRGSYRGRAITTNFIVAGRNASSAILDFFILWGRPAIC